MIFLHKNDQAATTVLLAERGWLTVHPDDVGVMTHYADMLYQMTRYDDALKVR